MGALLTVAPSQYDNLMRRLDELAKQIQDMRTEQHDQASSEAAARMEVAEQLRHALYGGNGDGPGIFERFRNLFDWRQEHITSHEHAGQERRSSTQDWRRFWIGVADRTFTVFFAIVAVLIVWGFTGQVIRLP